MSLRDALNGVRPLVLDGAMGTMIQSMGLREEDFRGHLFRAGSVMMLGNNDILSLTRPDVVREIHLRYLEAGADIITANTFSANRVSMADYGCEDFVREMNRRAVRIAREAVEGFRAAHSLGRELFVVATVGPTNKSLSMSPDVERPEFRAIEFDVLREAYVEQMAVLLEEGVDGILLETIFDTLNAKAALCAYEEACSMTGRRSELLLSATVNDGAGRLLSGQTVEAFLVSVEHADVLSVGLNCSFGARELLPVLRRLAAGAGGRFVSCHPNAGLPNALGLYDQTPELFAEDVRVMLELGLVDIVGGCCGTTPEHIRVLRGLVDGLPVSEARVARREAGAVDCGLALAGLEPLVCEAGAVAPFFKIGERCNVAGSRRFLRLIGEGAYDEALAIARSQIVAGAAVIDVNMDDGLLDARREMTTFLKLMAGEPDICVRPVMIDSSSWEVVSAGLKCVQGKCVVNSISLKEGEAVFVERAREVRRMGAAVVVMLFDEVGQATDFVRRVEIAGRAFRLLTEVVGMRARDIIFDPNVLSVATGMAEHDGYAYDFLRAVEWIRGNLPGVHVSGGVSNLSFSFRGNNFIREAMHAVFVHEGRLRGMDFAIVNPGAKVGYGDIEPGLRGVIEEVMLRPSPGASEALIGAAMEIARAAAEAKAVAGAGGNARGESVAEVRSVEWRLADALRSGVTDSLEADLMEALGRYGRAVDIIEGPLMEGMNEVGRLFGEGKMFLPQVVKTARTMKRAVAVLQPYIEAQRCGEAACVGRVLLATVKGDVHDIGKNIVSVVMACNGFEIVDLGVMVEPEAIVEAVLRERPDVIGLSGLITPSLEYMAQTLRLLAEAGISLPVMIGGATTSAVHTALRLAPVYGGPVVWVKDASQNAPLALRFINAESREGAFVALREEQEVLRRGVKPVAVDSLEVARENRPRFFE